MTDVQLRTVGENPTSILGVRDVIPVLNADTDIDNFFTEQHQRTYNHF